MDTSSSPSPEGQHQHRTQIFTYIPTPTGFQTYQLTPAPVATITQDGTNDINDVNNVPPLYVMDDFEESGRVGNDEQHYQDYQSHHLRPQDTRWYRQKRNDYPMENDTRAELRHRGPSAGDEDIHTPHPNDEERIDLEEKPTGHGQQQQKRQHHTIASYAKRIFDVPWIPVRKVGVYILCFIVISMIASVVVPAIWPSVCRGNSFCLDTLAVGGARWFGKNSPRHEHRKDDDPGSFADRLPTMTTADAMLKNDKNPYEIIGKRNKDEERDQTISSRASENARYNYERLGSVVLNDLSVKSGSFYNEFKLNITDSLLRWLNIPHSQHYSRGGGSTPPPSIPTGRYKYAKVNLGSIVSEFLTESLALGLKVDLNTPRGGGKNQQSNGGSSSSSRIPDLEQESMRLLTEWLVNATVDVILSSKEHRCCCIYGPTSDLEFAPSPEANFQRNHNGKSQSCGKSRLVPFKSLERDWSEISLLDDAPSYEDGVSAGDGDDDDGNDYWSDHDQRQQQQQQQQQKQEPSQSYIKQRQRNVSCRLGILYRESKATFPDSEVLLFYADKDTLKHIGESKATCFLHTVHDTDGFG